MLHIIKIYLLGVLTLLLPNILGAKNIEGWVYDNSDKKTPLIGVNVFWQGTTNGTTTNNNGYFKLKQQGGKQKLMFSYVGYKTDSVTVRSNSEISVYLKAGTDLNEVTVTERIASSSISKINPILTQNITSKELNKFACCNLSESFETNASVDVSYADAVSGIKQIKMLGLSGRYSQLMFENVPILRGGETAFGLEYIPGTWMKSIQVSKGTSAVKNGYESITGQININYQDADSDEKMHFYAYANQDGKAETNVGYSHKINDKWGTTILASLASNTRKLDMNDDGFLDKPTSVLGNVMSRWNYKGEKVESKFGLSFISEKRNGGQTDFDHSILPQNQTPYGIEVDVTRVNAFSKIGFLFNRPSTSIGWISSANYFDRESFYGNNTFDVNQLNLYTNLIFQSYFGNTNHTYNTGLSIVYDRNQELLNSTNVGFDELVPGLFFEYNFIPSEQFSLLFGFRNDYSTIHGNFVTPRIHTKYSFPAYTTIRLSAGKGYRSPLLVSENSQLLASSRQFVVQENTVQEEAWNYGISISNEIPIADRNFTFTTEFFRTDFNNQLVVDLEQNNQQVYFYSLSGESYAHSFQVEGFYELFRRFDLIAGYRWNDVKTTYSNELTQVPFISKYKALVSAQYRTNLDKWQFDATVQFHGQQRLLQSNSNEDGYSQQYINVIAQITKNYRYWSFYIGAENLTDFTQENAIIGVDNPFGNDFDASQVWGPLYGRMFYVGIKYNLDKRF